MDAANKLKKVSLTNGGISITFINIPNDNFEKTRGEYTGRGQTLPSAAAAPPVGQRGPRLACHMMFQYDLFNFLTQQVGTSAIVLSVETEHGYLTTVTVPGDPFVARYLSVDNYVDDNKREAVTIFMNHLIDLGVVTLNGRRGPDFQAYVERLDAGRWGHYTLHNARCLVKRHLGARNFVFSPTGEEGRYNCSLQYPRYGRGNRILKIKKKKILSFFYFFR
jgi:hypothetical protein